MEYSIGISHPLITPTINNVTTSKVPSSKYTCWWKEILSLAENGLVKLKFSEIIDPITKNLYPEGIFFNVFDTLKLMGLSLVTVIFAGTGIKSIGTIMKMGWHMKWRFKEVSTIRNWWRGGKRNKKDKMEFTPFLLKEKNEIVSDIENDNNAEEGNKETYSFPI